MKKSGIDRRKFFKIFSRGAIGVAVMPVISNVVKASPQTNPQEEDPITNVADALAYPRTEMSMPGKFPAKVVQVKDANSVDDAVINYDVVNEMLKQAMLTLTGEKNIKRAWRKFFDKKDRIGLKVNPVAGMALSTSVEITKAVIEQLTNAGIPEKNLLIWDRREFQLTEAGFTKENFPGIKLVGTEQKDAEGSYYGKDGKQFAEKMIDKKWFYHANIEGEYDEYTMPFMVNGGEYSYFSKIITQDVDKVINIPILKNAGATVTLAMKNLAYGVITNTGRLHKQLWGETIADVCAFPPVRDKVVLNIVDGIKGCYDGGPGANPQFFTNYESILVATDPVALDRVGHEIVIKKRIEEGIQEEDKPRYREFLERANGYNLGESDLEKIEWIKK